MKAKVIAETEKEKRHVNKNEEALAETMKVDGDFKKLSVDKLAILDPLAFSIEWDIQVDGKKKTKLTKKKKERETVGGIKASQSFYRERLLHQRSVPLGVPMPRVSVDQIDSGDPAFDVFRDRIQPFILTVCYHDFYYLLSVDTPISIQITCLVGINGWVEVP